MGDRYIPVDVLCKFEGRPCEAPTPVKFRITRQDGSRTTINVDQVKDVSHEADMSNHTIKYRCITTQGQRQVEYELRYVLKYMKWDLRMISS